MKSSSALLIRLLYPAILLSAGLACGKKESSKTDKKNRHEASESAAIAVEPGCRAEIAVDCARLETEITALRQNLAEAANAGDEERTREIGWDLNRKAEQLAVLRQGHNLDSDLYKAIEQKYEAIRALWNRAGNGSGLRPYTEDETLAVRKAVDDFGDLYIAESPPKLDANGQPLRAPNGQVLRVNTIVEARGPMPWTGYWYPTRKNLVLTNPTSALAQALGKLDRLSLAMGTPVESVQWEIDNANGLGLNPDIISEWEGLCDAWAYAAMLRPEPTRALEMHSIVFTVADLKGLLTKMYENTDATHRMATEYGTRYNGNSDSDGNIQDVRPEAFHRIAEVLLGERRTVFGVDTDAGMEVWNKPLYKMSWTIAPDEHIANAYVVKAFPKFVRQLNNPRSETTAELITIQPVIEAPAYTYRLYVDPSQTRDGKQRVVYGEWLDDARDHHPDTIFVPDSTIVPKPANKELGKALRIIDELLRRGRTR